MITIRIILLSKISVFSSWDSFGASVCPLLTYQYSVVKKKVEFTHNLMFGVHIIITFINFTACYPKFLMWIPYVVYN
jgi:hypothetical protein